MDTFSDGHIYVITLFVMMMFLFAELTTRTIVKSHRENIT